MKIKLMNKETVKQKNYWNKKVDDFDSIYSHEKGALRNYLDSIFRKDMYQRFDYTMESVEPIQNRTFLDVGCGTGRYSLELARKEASEVIGIDISEKMIEICRQRAAEEQLDDRLAFIQTDLLEYQRDIKVDVCIAMGLFDYIIEPLPLLTRIRESIRDVAIMSFPRKWTWRAPVRKIRLGLKNCNVYFYSPSIIGDLLKKAGYERYDITVIGQLYCVAAFPE